MILLTISMHIEAKIILSFFKVIKYINGIPILYGKIYNNDVLLVFTGIGQVNAALLV